MPENFGWILKRLQNREKIFHNFSSIGWFPSLKVFIDMKKKKIIITEIQAKKLACAVIKKEEKNGKKRI